MNHLMPKARLAEFRTATTASSNQPSLVRKRGPIMHLTGPNAFKTDCAPPTSNALPEPVSAVASLLQPTSSSDTIDAETKKPRKKRSKPKIHEYPPIPLDQLKWLTIAQATRRYPAFTEKSFRHHVAQAEAYAKHPKSGLRSNGFLPCIVRPAGQRKVLIDADAFEQWLSSNQMGGNHA